jgi:Arc/MetJ-type ribon-helix-helix transcriptional regulator
MRMRKADLRLPEMVHDYLDDLVKKVVYGDSKSEVIRRFVDEGVNAAINAGRLAERNPADYGDD